MKTGIYWQDPKYALKPGQDFIFDPSLVLYLPLHKLDGASIMSRDAYGHLCTVTGALWRPNGRWFDGLDDKIIVPDHASLRMSLYITIEMWCKFDTINFPETDSILEKGGRGGGTSEYNFYTDAGNDVWFGAALADTPAWRSGKVILDVAQDTWYHLVITYDGANFQGYKNAVPETPVAQTGVMYSGTSDIKIFGTSAYLDGTCGEVRIYNRVLSPLEIQGNYLATKRRYR